MLNEKLDALFHQQFKAKNVQATAEGVAKKTRQRLHSAFTTPIAGRSSSNSSTASAPVTLTPYTNNSTPRVVSVRSSS
jgi:response regulator of citrate/malate metabolism